MLHRLLARQVAFILLGSTASYPVAHLNVHVSPKTFVSLNKHLGGETVNLGSTEIAPHFTPKNRNGVFGWKIHHCTLLLRYIKICIFSLKLHKRIKALYKQYNLETILVLLHMIVNDLQKSRISSIHIHRAVGR